jgi:bifunctional non-homologous end joining protein LigD
MAKPRVSFEGAEPRPFATKLHYHSATSDKVYHLSLEAAGPLYPGLWLVNFAFGRRGPTLQTGTKTKAPGSYGEARRIYEKILSEKTGEGYRVLDQTPEPSHAPAGALPFEGIEPMLCSPIDVQEAEQFIQKAQWWMQEKFDGKRVLLYKTNGSVGGSNRKRALVALPVSVACAASTIPGDWILDGELVGETYRAFDALALNREDLRPLPLTRRVPDLAMLAGFAKGDAIRLAQWAINRQSKQDLYQALVEMRGEGVVFKRTDSTYQPGRKPTNWPWLKCKFVATASLMVCAVNQKRSVDVMTANGARVGSVSIPPNRDIPPVGQIIEVRYLYAYRGGSLFQPVYLGPRDDLDRSACTEAQLKYKPEEEA